MPNILTLDIDEHSRIGIAVAESETDGMVRSAKDLPLVSEVSRLEDLVGKVTGVCRKIGEKLNELDTDPLKPAETTVEFGVSVTTEAGAFIARAAGEGSLKITMTWRRAPAKQGEKTPGNTQ